MNPGPSTYQSNKLPTELSWLDLSFFLAFILSYFHSFILLICSTWSLFIYFLFILPYLLLFYFAFFLSFFLSLFLSYFKFLLSHCPSWCRVCTVAKMDILYLASFCCKSGLSTLLARKQLVTSLGRLLVNNKN